MSYSERDALIVEKASSTQVVLLPKFFQTYRRKKKMATNMGFRLFPPPPTKERPSRDSSTRRNRLTQSLSPAQKVDRLKSPDMTDEGQPDHSSRQAGYSNGQNVSTYPHPAIDETYMSTAGTSSNNPYFKDLLTELPRSHTSFSDAPTLVQGQINASHSSLAKPRLNNAASQGDSRFIRSMFPQYNPDLPLEQQLYYPTQASPSHFPKTVISKAPYSPELESRSQIHGSPLSAATSKSNWPKDLRNIASRPKDSCSTEELKALWKVTNGWRVSPSEGRSFCLKMNSAIDIPVHTLSSTTQPFYTLRLDPTSTSALLTMSRHDPNKTKGSSFPKRCSGIEVMTTNLEEPARCLPPNDGLVANLYPRLASTMALDLSAKVNSDKQAIMAAAEHESARLVWDHDAQQYYLVHPAMSTPFRITIESRPVWSRVDYTLEHPQLPQNLARLTRDGSGGGFLEIHTGVAATIECFYIVDVAVCAVMLVAIEEERKKKIERFDAPPIIGQSLSPELAKGKNSAKIEEMDVDLESHDSLSDRKGKKDRRHKLPAPTRGILGLLFMLLKFFVWGLTVFVNAVASLIIAVSNRLAKS